MRIALLVLALAATLTACSSDAGSDASTGAEDVEAQTTAAAKRAVPIAMEALGATTVEAYSQWTSCMALSWRHEVFGTIRAAADPDPASQLERVRAALVDSGHTDTTQVDGHVTVERDDVTIDVQQPGAARDPDVWRFSVRSSCADYDGAEKARVEDDDATPFDLTP